MKEADTERQTDKKTEKEILLYIENSSSELPSEQQWLCLYKTAPYLIPHLTPFTLLDVFHWRRIVKGTENSRTSKQPSHGQLREQKWSKVAQSHSHWKICSGWINTASLSIAAYCIWPGEDWTHGASVSTFQAPHRSRGHLWIHPWRSRGAGPGMPIRTEKHPVFIGCRWQIVWLFLTEWFAHSSATTESGLGLCIIL